MARIRSIKPEFFTSAQVVECSTNARLLFVGLWCFCDDHGTHRAGSLRIKMEVFPGDPFSEDEIEAMTDELCRAGLLSKYRVGHEWFFSVTGWRHQKIDKRQEPKYPTLAEAEEVLSFAEHSQNGSRTVVERSLLIGREGIGEERNGEEGRGEERKRKESRDKPTHKEPAAPESLPFDSNEFRVAWITFISHRKEIKKPLKPTSTRMALKALGAMGETRAIAALNHTVAMGWQGIREPDAAAAPLSDYGPDGRPRQLTPAELAAGVRPKVPTDEDMKNWRP